MKINAKSEKKLLDIIIPHRLTPRKWFLSVSYLVWIEFRGFFEVFKKIKIASQKYRKLYPRKKLFLTTWHCILSAELTKT